MRRVSARLLFLSISLLLGCAMAQAQTAPILYQHPTVNVTRIVFAYAGSLWSVARQGGVGQRLTGGVRVDSDPILSPDGTQLAFTRNNHGNLDVYVMPAEGGPARRLTWHPGPDVTVGWTDDSKNVLFRSTRYSVDPLYFRLFTVPVTGGLPTALPLPYANQGSYSPNGSRLAYVPFRNHAMFEAFKHYRGGMQPRIRIALLSDSSVRTLPRGGGNNMDPMWVGDSIYFLSDRTGGHYRLYRYQLSTKSVQPISPDDGHDILTASAGALDTPHPAIVYAEMGKLFLLNVNSGRIQRVPVVLHADFPDAQPHWDAVGHTLTHPGISPHGVRAVFQAHCDILTVPSKYGNAEDITRTTGACERYPAWSPNGKWIAYFSDASGQYELDISPQNGIGKVRKITLGTHPTFSFGPAWSPDSHEIAYSDVAQRLWIVNVETGKRTLVGRHYYYTGGDWLGGNGFHPSWSADSRWLSYTNMLPNHLHAIFVYSLTSGESTQITDGMSDAKISRFDPSGKYLYFIASTNPNPSASVGDLSGINQPTVYSAYVAVLQKGVPSPLAPRSGEEKPPHSGAHASQSKPKGGAAAAPKQTIDFAGLRQRILALPIPARAYRTVAVSAPGVLWLTAGAVVSQNQPDHPALALYRFSLKTRKEKRVLASVSSFALAADGKKMLIQQGPQWRIVPAAASVSAGAGALDTADLQVRVNPPREWRQMYYEVWRLEQDYFYSPQMNGLDLPAAVKYYARFLPGVQSHADLMYLFHDMLGNLSVSHMFLYRMGKRKPTPIGLLGADYRIEHDRYRFSRIFSGENWNPGLHAPLTQPGVSVKVGEYLLQVNGRPLYGNENVYSFFQNTVGKQVVLTVGADPDGSGSHQVTVVPVASELALRNRAWIHHNRLLVDRLSHGRLAYVYLPDTETGGWTYFNRYYFSQIGKQGIIVDERFNHGGDLANYVIDELQQPLLSFWFARYGHTVVTPAAIFGPKVMIANHFSGSGGDYLPYVFKQEHVGTLVGTRTWGGLVGIGNYPALMDGTHVTAPNEAVYFPNGKWDVENHGVTPQVEVRLNPKLWREGKDPQLQAAVAIALRELKAHPFHMVPHPPYPNRSAGLALGLPVSKVGH